MTLKEQIADDLADGVVWFNEGDFAELHEVNGAFVLCEIGAMRDAPHRVSRSTGGVVRDASYCFIRKSDFATPPRADQNITIDGVRYRISNVMEDIGCYVIEFGRFDDADLRRQFPGR